MSTWRTLADEMGTDDALTNMNDTQITAVIDGLSLIMYADEKVTMLERHEFEDLLCSLPWMDKKHDMVESYLEKALDQAKGATDSKVFDEIARHAAAEIADQAARLKVFAMAAAMAYADLRLDARESEALKHLAEAFEISDGDAQRILADAG